MMKIKYDEWKEALKKTVRLIARQEAKKKANHKGGGGGEKNSSR